MIAETIILVPLFTSIPIARARVEFQPIAGNIAEDRRLPSLNAPLQSLGEEILPINGPPRAATFLSPAQPNTRLTHREASYRKASAELARYVELAADPVEGVPWDAEGAITEAFAFLESVPSNVPMPRPMLLSEQVGLFWDFGDVYAEIDFDGSGYVDAYGKRPGTPEVNLDRWKIADAQGRMSFPTQLEGIISDKEG